MKLIGCIGLLIGLLGFVNPSVWAANADANSGSSRWVTRTAQGASTALPSISIPDTRKNGYYHSASSQPDQLAAIEQQRKDAAAAAIANRNHPGWTKTESRQTNQTR